MLDLHITYAHTMRKLMPGCISDALWELYIARVLGAGDTQQPKPVAAPPLVMPSPPIMIDDDVVIKMKAPPLGWTLDREGRCVRAYPPPKKARWAKDASVLHDKSFAQLAFEPS